MSDHKQTDQGKQIKIGNTLITVIHSFGEQHLKDLYSDYIAKKIRDRINSHPA